MNEKPIVKTIVSPFELSVREGRFEIKIASSLRDRAWGAYFGEVQLAIRNQEWDSKCFGTIVIDFRNCIWSDPLPLLSLGIVLAEHKDKGGKSHIILPSARTPSLATRFLKFIAQEGFLYIFIENSNSIRSEKEIIGKQQVNKFKQITVDLCFVNSTFLPAAILNLVTEDSIERWVEHQMDLADSIIDDKAPAWTHDDLLHRLKIFLHETLHNIFVHAYPKNHSKYAGVYVRFREGFLGEDNHIQRHNLVRALKQENDERVCPSLPKYFLENRQGAIEVFVIDAGIGMCNHLYETEPADSSIKRRRLKNAWNDVFLDEGFSASKRNNTTKYGGLHLLGQLLKENEDFIRAYDDDYWYGSSFPIHRSFGNPMIGALGNEHCKNYILGLNWTSRFSWFTATDTAYAGWLHWSNVLEKNPFLEEYYLSEVDILQFNNLPVNDQRFTKNKVELEKLDTSKYYLLLPTINLSKKDILTLLENLANQMEYSKKRTLIIADIPSHECSIYIAALDEYFLQKKIKWPKYFSKIVLVSRRLTVCVLTYQSKRYEHGFSSSIEATKKMFSSHREGFCPSENILHLFRWLRYYDSVYFWKRIASFHLHDRTFILGKIRWTGRKIDNFLDFSQTLTDPICLQLYRIALQRLPGMFPLNRCKTIGLDNHVKNLVTEFNAVEYPRMQGNENIIGIGSIYVTGYTQMSFAKKNDLEDIEKFFHFFRHENATNRVLSLFLWVSSVFDVHSHEKQPTLFSTFFEEWSRRFTKENGYERIGNTPTIAKGGNKYFPLPRFDKQEQSAYYRTPKQTYEDWQASHPITLKPGHWEYESQHDFITINIWLALKDAFQTKGQLACFLLGEFFYNLRLKNKSFSQEGQFWSKKVYEYLDSRQYNLSIFPSRIIVYPSHPITDYAVEKISECLTPEIAEKIIPARLARQSVGSAILVSPLVIERIEKKLSTMPKGKREIILFDSTIISGRTRKALKHMLFRLGADEVYTLSIVDRQRLPMKVPDSDKHKSYWRLDIPRLGGKRICALCRGLEIAENFKTALASDLSKKRITQWYENWGKKNPLTNWKGHGLSPVSVEINNPQKKFGIRPGANGDYSQIGGDSQLIDIKKSIGLTTYIAEIYSMTFVDDLPIRYCKEDGVNNAAKIEFLSVQLLLFGNEFQEPLKQELMYHLFYAAYNEKPSSHTALAALILIAQGHESLFTMYQRIFDAEQLDAQLNRDLCIVVAYIIHHKFPNTSKRLEQPSRILCGSTNLPSIYNTLHLEVYSETGTAHPKPLQVFIKDKGLNFDVKGSDALDSFSKLKFLIKNIGFDLPRVENSQKSYPEFQLELLNEIDLVFGKLEFALDKKNKELNEEAEFVVGKFINKLEELHDRFFYKLSIKDINRGYSRILDDELANILFKVSANRWRSIAARKQIECRWNEAPKIGISNSGMRFPNINLVEEAWVVWDNKIKEIVVDLAKNVIHSTRIITDPWKIEKGKADLWIKVDYLPDFLTITFANASKKKADIIAEETKEKGRWWHLEDLGGKIQYRQLRGKRIAVEISIPYVGNIKLLH